MSDERLFSLRNVWFRAGVGATIVVFVAAVLIGFVWLPSAKSDPQFQGIWNAICSAAGVPRQWHPVESAVAPDYKVSTVELTPHMLDGATSLSIGRGATLALRCTMCHGARGVSAANTPNLAGQYAASIYKEMQDFQSGARTSAVMAPMVMGLSDQDLRDLSLYYASLPRAPSPSARETSPSLDIVAVGSPMRNIAPCGSCHGSLENKLGAPWLSPQPRVYLKSQLEAFASGKRHNDISGQMRNIARHMTPDEIDASAAYYAGSQ